MSAGSRPAATSKVELFVIIVNGFQPLTIITKSSTLDVATVLDPSLIPVPLIILDIFTISEKIELLTTFEREMININFSPVIYH